MKEEHNKKIAEEIESFINPSGRINSMVIAVITISIMSILIWSFYKKDIKGQISGKELKRDIRFESVKTTWIKKESYKDENGEEEIIIVPQIKFKIRSKSEKELKWINFIGIFRFTDTGKNIGEGNMMSIKEGISKNQLSEEICIKSSLGYRGPSLEAFRKNSKDWRDAYVEIYARQGSVFQFIKSFNISKRLEGLDLEIKLKTLKK